MYKYEMYIIKTNYGIKLEKNSTYGIRKGLYVFIRFLSSPIAPIIVIYNGAELNGIIFSIIYVK